MARTTIGLKRVLAQLVAGFLLTGALVTAIPTPSPDDPSQTPDTFETSTEGQDGQVNNFAADFVAQLIANATQIDEDLQASARKRGQLKCKSAPSLVVNLGYARYQGTANTATGITSWKGSEHIPLFPFFFPSSELTSAQNPLRGTSYRTSPLETTPGAIHRQRPADSSRH